MDKCRINEPPIVEFKSHSEKKISYADDEKKQIIDSNNQDKLINKNNNDIKQHYAKCWLY